MDNKTDILAYFNSPAIEKRLSKIRDRKGKNAFLESIMSNLNAEVLNETITSSPVERVTIELKFVQSKKIKNTAQTAQNRNI